MGNNKKKKRYHLVSDDSCLFCKTKINCELTLGKMLKKDKITVHYFCLLFSSGLIQKGKTDDDGILGFLPQDILKESRRGYRLKCCYCKKTGATIGCTVTNCRRKFHLPCGIENDSLHQFFDTFCSFCVDHRPRQIISTSDRLSFHGTAKTICPICLVGVEARTSNQTLRAPCCKNSWFHRQCLQRQALNAGYFFKCPLCNNKDVFQAEMLTYGIYIPEQDASWELEENAFHELLYRHNQCDADVCKCPMGRNFEEEVGSWEITLCETCGSQGVHNGCAELKWFRPRWKCSTCQDILNTANKEAKTHSAAESASVQQQVSSEQEEKPEQKKKEEKKKTSKRKIEYENTENNFYQEKKIRISPSDMEEEIDVETVNDGNNLQLQILSSYTLQESESENEINICDESHQLNSDFELEENKNDDSDFHLFMSPSSTRSCSPKDDVIICDTSSSDDDSDVELIGITPSTTSSFELPQESIPVASAYKMYSNNIQDETKSASDVSSNSHHVIVHSPFSSANSSKTNLINPQTQVKHEWSDCMKNIDNTFSHNAPAIAMHTNTPKRKNTYVQTTLSPFFRKRKQGKVEVIDLTQSDATINPMYANYDSNNVFASNHSSLMASNIHNQTSPSNISYIPRPQSDHKIELLFTKGSPPSSFKIVVKNNQSFYV